MCFNSFFGTFVNCQNVLIKQTHPPYQLSLLIIRQLLGILSVFPPNPGIILNLDSPWSGKRESQCVHTFNVVIAKHAFASLKAQCHCLGRLVTAYVVVWLHPLYLHNSVLKKSPIRIIQIIITFLSIAWSLMVPSPLITTTLCYYHKIVNYINKLYNINRIYHWNNGEQLDI